VNKEWVRIFFDAGGWSWTATNEPVAACSLGFSTGAMLSVDHDGDRTNLQIIPPAA
jgi:hypothetical protein